MHGQYLGSATVVYAQASAARNAIKEYNGAQLDDRVMKIEYASRLPEGQSPTKMSLGRQSSLNQKINKPLPMRKGPNAIQKSKSMNSMGNNQQQRGML